MTVMILADVSGQTEAGYDGMLAVLEDQLLQAEGFVLHSAYLAEGHWHVVELWRSRADADRFFTNYVAPHLPPGVRPKRSIHEVHSCVTARNGERP